MLRIGSMKMMLHGVENPDIRYRDSLAQDHAEDAELPCGVFRPYAGVSTAILLFTRTDSGGTDGVWFYDMRADGWSLDDKRAALPEKKLGPTPAAALDAAEAARNDLLDALARWRQRDGAGAHGAQLCGASPGNRGGRLGFVAEPVQGDGAERCGASDAAGNIGGVGAGSWRTRWSYPACHAHAEFIQRRFDAHYPAIKGAFARVIDFKVDDAQSLIDSFSHPAKTLHIAISVDMLDTGIDGPEVVTLVLFKLVRSKTKFWQMIGRGTRLRRDLFGPGRDKAFFYVFDFCQNLGFFSQNAEMVEGSTADSRSARLFKTRLDLLAALDERAADATLRHDVADLLRLEVAAMNTDNFLVRRHRRMVKTYAKPEAWAALDEDSHQHLASGVAGLPSERPPGGLEAKQFDMLALRCSFACWAAP